MLERIALAGLLALSVMGNVSQWWNGEQRYQDGVAHERAAWTRVIEDRNAQIEQLAAELGAANAETEARRADALARIAGVKLEPLPLDIALQCSTPKSLRAALNSIGGRGP